MTAHVTDRQLGAFLDGTLPSAEVVALDAHLSLCAECRTRAHDASAPAASRLARELAVGPELHPDDEQLADFVDGRSSPDVTRHLADCAECTATVEDLRLLKTAIGTRRRSWTALWPAIAAAAVVVIGLSLWMWPRLPRRSASQTSTSASRELRIKDGSGTLVIGESGEIRAGLNNLSSSERATIALALASGTLPEAHNLTDARSQAGRLMGAGSTTTPASFGPLAPVATAVDNVQPELRWSRLDGALSYVVTVVDSELHPVADSPALTGTSWRPASPLPRGRVYLWQVRAKLTDGVRTAPAPPEPEARFFVLSDTEAADVASLRQRAGDSALVAILLAQHGLLDDADAALAKAAAENPSVPALPRLKDALRDARARPATDRR